MAPDSFRNLGFHDTPPVSDGKGDAELRKVSGVEKEKR